MRIGVMLRHFGQYSGGVLIYTRSVLEHLLAIDSDNEYILIYGDQRFIGTYSTHENVREVVLRIPTKLLWDQWGVPRIVRRYGIDVVFNPKFTVPFLTRARTVLVLHGSEWFVLPENYPWLDRMYFQHLMPLYYRRADALIAISNLVKEEIVQYTGVRPEKIHVIYHGYDESRFVAEADVEGDIAVGRRYELPEQFVLWVGWIYPGKNVRTLLHAFARAANEIPHDLVMVGDSRWGDGKSPELDLLEELGISHRVHLVGQVGHEELASMYRLADAFVFPSLYEGFGLPLIEAMACGCPVLSANTCAIPEVVGDAALLVNPRDAHALSDSLQQIVSSTGPRERLREAGLERVKQFSWRRSAREHLELLRRISGAS